MQRSSIEKALETLNTSYKYLESKGQSFEMGLIYPAIVYLQEAVGGDESISKISNVGSKTECELPYTLPTLQRDGYERFNLTAGDVLHITTRLYEHNLISYPRTDCGYLAESQFNDACGVLFNLAKNGYHNALKADFRIKSNAWNNEKVGSNLYQIPVNCGIIPTGESVTLDGHDKLIYDMIVERYIEQFNVTR